jgi:hypothetical protein
MVDDPSTRLKNRGLKDWRFFLAREIREAQSLLFRNQKTWQVGHKVINPLGSRGDARILVKQY